MEYLKQCAIIQYVDWSDTTPKRGKEHVRPEDKDGDPTPLVSSNKP